MTSFFEKNLIPKYEIRNGIGVMLNLVQHLVLSRGQILKSETLILKQVQDDRLNLEFVSDFDIRISSFTHTTSFQIPPTPFSTCLPAGRKEGEGD